MQPTVWEILSDNLSDYRGIVRCMAHRPGHLERDNTKRVVLDDFY